VPPVSGHILPCVFSQLTMAVLSYTFPYTVFTGSLINLCVSWQTNSAGVSLGRSSGGRFLFFLPAVLSSAFSDGARPAEGTPPAPPKRLFGLPVRKGAGLSRSAWSTSLWNFLGETWFLPNAGRLPTQSQNTRYQKAQP
jgi:hypothetical protein